MALQDEIDELKRRLPATEQQLAEKNKLDAVLRESEARHRLIVEILAQAEWETNAEGVVVADSPSWRAYTGQTLDEWLGYGWLDAVHPDDRAYAERQWREAVAARGRVNAEFRLRAPDGAWRWTNVRATPVLDRQGRIEKWAGINIDIDARKRAEVTLQQSEERLRGVLDSMAEGFASFDADFMIRDVNAETLRLDGRSREELVGHSHWEAFPGTEHSTLGTFYRQVARERRPGALEHVYHWPDGRAMWVDLRAYPMPDGGMAVSWRDITQRKAAEQALRESEERYRALFESMDEAYAVVDVLKGENGDWVDFRFVEVNPAFLAHTSMPWPVGKTATELLSKPNPRWTKLYGQTLDTNRAIRIEEAEPTLGRTFDLNIFTLDRARNRVAVLFTDITARKNAEASLAASEEKFRKLFDAIDAGLAVVEMIYDEAGEITDMVYRQTNTAYERQGGVYNVVGRPIFDVIPGVEEHWLSPYKEVARTGVARRVQNYQQDVDRWFDVYFSRVDDAGRFVAIVFNDITYRKHAEIGLRESEERQTFLLKFSDALRVQGSVEAVANSAIQMVSEKMQLDRCYITLYRPDDDAADFPYQTGNHTVPPLPARVRLSDFPDAYEQVLEKTFVVEDDFERRGLSDAERANSKALGMRAMLASTVRRGEKRPLSSMMAISSNPRRWTNGEIALMEDAAERTWAAMERARSEAALRESEERFRQFAQASAAGLWIRDAKTLDMEFVSPAVGKIYGVPPDALLGDVKHWAAMILPEDRGTALVHLERARQGQSELHEFRIRRASDGAFRWIRSTDFPLRDDGHIPRIGGIAEDVTEAKLAVEHQRVLLAELQHRVRNIMAMIRSMANRTAGGAPSVQDYRTLLEGRLLALARVQTLLTRQANAGAALRPVLESEMGAQAQGAGKYDLTGPDIMLSPRLVEVLTLAFHELATNALKYGALSVQGGAIHVVWSVIDRHGAPWLVLDWEENGAPLPAPPKRRGFGSELIERRIPYELRGTGKLSFEPAGLRCRLELPLREGESILETDAPMPTMVYGGILDMTGAPDLGGKTILVVEDDFYSAFDTAAALQSAGAAVLGPFSNPADTRAALLTYTPDAAVVDLNLGGGGPNFDVARLLKRRGIPFVVLTGYDADVMPEDLAAIPRLQKPIPLRDIVEAIGQLWPRG